ncbi:MAG: hypothetical protein MUF49_02010 [Oculatellaceae cyanobacterium Prado106]|nr:hypothetical protein [Oculatellaceae cyanobacterium Prado106]
MRLLRIIGIFLSSIAVFLLLSWLLNTLVPLNRLNSLQPLKPQELASTPPGTLVLFECHIGSTLANPESTQQLPLDCGNDNFLVQYAASHIKNLPPVQENSNQTRAIAISDPVVVIGKVQSGEGNRTVKAELVAYGSRLSNLNTFRGSGILQIIVAEVIGGIGILAIFIDWRMARSKRNHHIRTARQMEQAQTLQKQNLQQQLAEAPVYQRRR